jgi:hypothetical protein
LELRYENFILGECKVIGIEISDEAAILYYTKDKTSTNKPDSALTTKQVEEYPDLNLVSALLDNIVIYTWALGSQ